MSLISLIGLISLTFGIFLIGFGLQKTKTLTNKIVEGVTGHYSRRTMWALIGGGILILLGIILLFMGGHSPVVT
jgi:hypothetical protein